MKENQQILDDSRKEDDKKDAKFNDASLPDPTRMSEVILAEQIMNVRSGTCKKLAWRAAEVREHLRLVWQNDKTILLNLFPFFSEVGVLVE